MGSQFPIECLFPPRCVGVKNRTAAPFTVVVLVQQDPPASYAS